MIIWYFLISWVVYLCNVPSADVVSAVPMFSVAKLTATALPYTREWGVVRLKLFCYVTVVFSVDNVKHLTN